MATKLALDEGDTLLGFLLFPFGLPRFMVDRVSVISYISSMEMVSWLLIIHSMELQKVLVHYLGRDIMLSEQFEI